MAVEISSLERVVLQSVQENRRLKYFKGVKVFPAKENLGVSLRLISTRNKVWRCFLWRARERTFPSVLSADLQFTRWGGDRDGENQLNDPHLSGKVSSFLSLRPANKKSRQSPKRGGGTTYVRRITFRCCFWWSVVNRPLPIFSPWRRNSTLVEFLLLPVTMTQQLTPKIFIRIKNQLTI